MARKIATALALLIYSELTPFLMASGSLMWQMPVGGLPQNRCRTTILLLLIRQTLSLGLERRPILRRSPMPTRWQRPKTPP